MAIKAVMGALKREEVCDNHQANGVAIMMRITVTRLASLAVRISACISSALRFTVLPAVD